jgi:hypothetical protein
MCLAQTFSDLDEELNLTVTGLAAKLFEQELTYEDQLMGNLNRKLKR